MANPSRLKTILSVVILQPVRYLCRGDPIGDGGTVGRQAGRRLAPKKERVAATPLATHAGNGALLIASIGATSTPASSFG